jgi:N-acetyl sugar amidotransferase
MRMAGYRQCVRCCIDTTVPGASFDGTGVCSFCHLHDRLERDFPIGSQGQQILEMIATRIRRAGHGKRYDCVVGISGGRDSSYTLHMIVRELRLRPLAVHFNDGFGNPIAGENMRKITAQLGVDLRTISSDWRESKDLRIAALKASTPDLELATDIGIGSSLYGAAVQENVRYVVIGQSFRTEGIAPLEWNFLDGRYLKAISKQFGQVPIRPWKPDNPGFNLNLRELIYYTAVRRIRTVLPLYYRNYIRRDADQLLASEYGWVNPGAHYLDDLYQALMNYVLRIKFNIDRRKFNYAALVRSGQMTRSEALELIAKPYNRGEDPQLVKLCVKRLGLKWEEFDELLKLPQKNFRDYPTNFGLLRALRPAIWLLANLGFVPQSSYLKYCTGRSIGSRWHLGHWTRSSKMGHIAVADHPDPSPARLADAANHSQVFEPLGDGTCPATLPVGVPPPRVPMASDLAR